MAEDPTKLKSDLDKQEAAAELNRQRGAARQQQAAPAGGAQPSLRVLQGGKQQQPDQQDAPGQQLSPDEQKSAGGKLVSDRAKARKKRDDKKKAAPQKGEPGFDPNYPNPISLRVFMVFGMIATMQDLLPLLFDLIGIGWLIGYLLLPLTWFFYWYLIIRNAPKTLKKKFWMRSALVSLVGLIPAVGEILPEWIAVAFGAYIYIRRYTLKTAVEQTAGASKESRQSSGGERKKAAS